jgi:DNA polymerase-3 subunit gamma/tau
VALSSLAISAPPAAAPGGLPLPLAAPGALNPAAVSQQQQQQQPQGAGAAGAPPPSAGLPVYAAAGPGAPLPPGYTPAAGGVAPAAGAQQPGGGAGPQVAVVLDLSGQAPLPASHAPAAPAGCKPGLDLS